MSLVWLISRPISPLHLCHIFHESFTCHPAPTHPSHCWAHLIPLLLDFEMLQYSSSLYIISDSVQSAILHQHHIYMQLATSCLNSWCHDNSQQHKLHLQQCTWWSHDGACKPSSLFIPITPSGKHFFKHCTIIPITHLVKVMSGSRQEDAVAENSIYMTLW